MYRETIFKYYGYIGEVGQRMVTPIYPPTPSAIENLTIIELFRLPEMRDNLQEVKTAIYYLINPHITSMDKMGNWNAITSRVTQLIKDGIAHRRKMVYPTVSNSTESLIDMMNEDSLDP